MKLRAVVLGAGLGTRMKSDLPKVMHPVLGLPMVAWPIDRALELGCEQVGVVVGHRRELVEAFLADRYPPGQVSTHVQTEMRGTADAVVSSWDLWADLDGGVLILYGDVPNVPGPLLRSMVEQHAAGRSPVTFVTTVVDDPTGYGRIVRDEAGRTVAIVEHRDASDAQRAIREVNTGIYLVDAAFLRETLSGIRSSASSGEFYLTDMVAIAAERGAPATTLVTPTAEPTLGVNDRSELARAEAWARRTRNVAIARTGVTFRDLDGAHIEVDATVEPGATIEAGVQLLGRTFVGAGARIEQGSRLQDCFVGARAHVRAHTVADEASIGEDCAVGPFAHLRPGTELGPRVRIGNFVETKKATFAAGAKANHLSYIGDATVGADCNIGAGTITCNYDGVNKFRTVLEDGVFIGSDTQLVAPVHIGRGAFVGAGTTVTRDVPAGALAVSRTEQKNIEGWAERRATRRNGGTT